MYIFFKSTSSNSTLVTNYLSKYMKIRIRWCTVPVEICAAPPAYVALQIYFWRLLAPFTCAAPPSNHHITPCTLEWDTPALFFFSPLRRRHKKEGLDSVAARPPYRPYLGPWMELEDDRTFHPISLRLALPAVIRYRRCDARPWS